MVAERMGSRSPPAKYIHSKTEEKKIKARHGWAESKSKDESRGSQKYSVTPPPKKEKEMLVLNPKAHPWCDFALHGYPTATDTPFQSLMT